MNANSLSTNLIVTALALVMVFVLPWADRRICRRLGLNLQGGLSSNPRAETLLRVRFTILCTALGVYLAALAYLVFFSRSASEDYQVHIAPFADLRNAVRIDYGVFGLLRSLLTEGLSGAAAHVKIVRAEDITQVYMNVMLMVPMGYLLPYIFPWFRAKARIRPVMACFAAALLTENLQLIFRRGFYDMDDLIANTLGGLVGQSLFRSVAYVVTHPDWRKERASYRRWKRNARTRTLYPFARRMDVARAALLATDEGAIWDFYVMKLGFRLIGQLVPMDSEGTDLLLEMGRCQIEVHCSNRTDLLPQQTLTFSVRRLRPIIRRLRENGIETGEILQDPYTAQRSIRLQGPDGVSVVFIER
ncbi:MAG: VanZ family protein [Clostridia bacterium]|nr:VanZ family protein [Clostridia bacterium]